MSAPIDSMRLAIRCSCPLARPVIIRTMAAIAATVKVETAVRTGCLRRLARISVAIIIFSSEFDRLLYKFCRQILIHSKDAELLAINKPSGYCHEGIEGGARSGQGPIRRAGNFYGTQAIPSLSFQRVAGAKARRSCLPVAQHAVGGNSKVIIPLAA